MLLLDCPVDCGLAFGKFPFLRDAFLAILSNQLVLQGPHELLLLSQLLFFVMDLYSITLALLLLY
jgi:hypothetical protein